MANKWAREYDPKPPTGDETAETELTVALMNHALVTLSRERGYCLCIHPMMNVINFSGTECAWCGQPVTDAAWAPEAKGIRTEAIKAAYPWAVKSA